MTTFPDVTAAPGRADAGVTTARVDWAPVPKVNLLPPEILQARRIARLKRVLAGALLVTVAACGAATYAAAVSASDAQEELDAVQARGSTLRAQQARYAAVPRVLGLLQSAGAAREKAMAQDVLWYGFLSDLAVTTPEGVTLNGLQVALDRAPAVQDPLVPPGIGTVGFTGTAKNFPDVAAWLEAVGTLHGMDGSSLQTATREDPATAPTGALNFTSNITVTGKALTHRYDRKAD